MAVSASLVPPCRRGMEKTKGWRIPPFGDWQIYGEMPITQCFESFSHAGVNSSTFFAEEDQLKLPVGILVRPGNHHGGHCRRKVRGDEAVLNGPVAEETGEAARRGGNAEESSAPNAVDEDLYKIPPEVLYEFQKKKRKRLLRSLLSGCLGLNCTP
ncbi:hypothetical protein HPP92_009712 [Vanilla planifolia]|uniref:Uncharacterized protein n=1 Tax=Vanilla planifolia TaxID=51239 RepID=A0A835RB08_VANPL|nr:hypothetical protein HPP92_009930 [Vanilla planifolia]KAG0487617.1 hypothetical protein HPP92_009712 [Vanilla planifolia]